MPESPTSNTPTLTNSSGPTFLESIVRISKTIVVVLVAFASALTFPSAIPWMTAAWIVAVFAFFWRNEIGRAKISMLLLFAILLLKYPENTDRFLLLLTSLLLCAALLHFGHSRKMQWVELTMLAIVFVWFSVGRWTDATRSTPLRFDPIRPIACLGDSLTEFGYPKELQKRVTVPVLDFGRNGCTLPEAIKDLLPQIVKQKPQLVVIELGGHDFKDGRPRSEAKRHYSTIIRRIREYGGEVVLVEIPRGFITDTYFGLERELASEFDLEVIPDTLIRRLVLFGPNLPPGSLYPREQLLSEDHLHPNARGNEAMANVIAGSLQRIFGSEIIK